MAKRGRPRKNQARQTAGVDLHWFDAELKEALKNKAKKLVDRGIRKLQGYMREEAPIRTTDLKSTTKKPPGELKRRMRLKSVRESQRTGDLRGGVRMAPHGHLVALGHKIVLRGSKVDTGKKSRANAFHERAMVKVFQDMPGIARQVAEEND